MGASSATAELARLRQELDDARQQLERIGNYCGLAAWPHYAEAVIGIVSVWKEDHEAVQALERLRVEYPDGPLIDLAAWDPKASCWTVWQVEIESAGVQVADPSLTAAVRRTVDELRSESDSI